MMLIVDSYLCIYTGDNYFLTKVLMLDTSPFFPELWKTKVSPLPVKAILSIYIEIFCKI